MDNTPYTLPSQALSFSVPLGWKKSAEADDYVRFEAPDQIAWMEAALESSGYQLEQAEVENYMTAMMNALYDGTDSYQLLDKQIVEGQAVYISSYQKNGFTWFVQDVFHSAQRSYLRAFFPGFKQSLGCLSARFPDNY